MTDTQDGLSIGALTQQTGVPAATLRSWEDRYGFPQPQRLAGGHRRYRPGDAALVESVLRLRATGMSLPAAISQATAQETQKAQEDQACPSVFAGLRSRYPSLVPQVMRKTTLLALTRAIEDECCARAQRPVLFASFQRQRYYRQAERRWLELARTAHVAVAFVGFAPNERPRATKPALVQVPLAADAPMAREWALVCDAPAHSACVSGWEFPGQGGGDDAARRFEVIWSADPRVVRDAALICAEVARSAASADGGLGARLAALESRPPPPASADLFRATGLLTRMTGYLEQAAG